MKKNRHFRTLALSLVAAGSLACGSDSPSSPTGGGSGGAVGSAGSAGSSSYVGGAGGMAGGSGEGGSGAMAGEGGSAMGGSSGSSGAAGAAGNAGQGGAGGSSGQGGSGGSAGQAGSGGGGGAVAERVRIYQIFARHFGNSNTTNAKYGTYQQNGSGKFSALSQASLDYLKQLNITHVWLTGVIRQATLTPWPGLPADDPDIVKGVAGSPFAIKDYYDVSPELADKPAERMQEFEAMVARIHAAGLKVMLDFVPNHVSRAYDSQVKPMGSFGKSDDKTKFFDTKNDFFYLVDPPGQSISITGPMGWSPMGMDGTFGPENGMAGNVPRATGNNQTGVSLGPNDWYETVKLNYGYNFANGQTSYAPQPSVWQKMDDILAYWQSKGVDGFRCDFSHYVPNEFWSYAIANAKQRDPGVYFLAEAYDDSPGVPQAGSAPDTHPQSLISKGGFDAVYDHWTFNTSRLLASGSKWANDFDDVRQGDTYVGKYTRYTENHDERRAASPLNQGGGPGDSAYGTWQSGLAHSAAVFLSSGAPLLVYAGQELGEKGAGAEGFGGEDGRSTIFDYWGLPSLAKLQQAGYQGANLPSEEGQVLAAYRQLMNLATDPVMGPSGAYYGLNWFNKDQASFGENGHNAYGFLRYLAGDRAWLVLCNLHPQNALDTTLKIPADALALMGFGDVSELSLTGIFPAKNGTSVSVSSLTQAGVSLQVPRGEYAVLELSLASP